MLHKTSLLITIINHVDFYRRYLQRRRMQLTNMILAYLFLISYYKTYSSLDTFVSSKSESYIINSDLPHLIISFLFRAIINPRMRIQLSYDVKIKDFMSHMNQTRIRELIHIYT